MSGESGDAPYKVHRCSPLLCLPKALLSISISYFILTIDIKSLQ